MLKISDIVSQMRVEVERILPTSTAKLRKRFINMFIDVLILFIVMDKVNFTQLGVYGRKCEKTYRRYFHKGMEDTVSFNLALAMKYFSGSVGVKAIAIDPSYISKSGKKTPGAGYFWSGVAGRAKWGLEILGIGIIDALRHECIMLGAMQSPNNAALSNSQIHPNGKTPVFVVGREAISDWDDIKDKIPEDALAKAAKRPYHRKTEVRKFNDSVRKDKDGDNSFDLMQWYLHVISGIPKEVRDYTNIIVADAFFSKHDFVDGLDKIGYELVSRLRDDAALWYVYRGPHDPHKPGAHKKYDGKVDINNLNTKVVYYIENPYNDGGEIHTGIVYSKALRRKIKIVVWFSKDRKTHKIYFSTDLTLSGYDILRIYRTRFQEEFEFRQAKGFASLETCQARDLRKIMTHFNISFTAVNCLKAAAKSLGIPFSISNLKTLARGQYLMKRFISVSGISPDSEIIKKLHNEVVALTTLDIKDKAA